MYILSFRLDVPYLKDTSIPIEETNKEVNQTLKQKINDGIYTLGEKIVPQVFEKVCLKNEKLCTEEIIVKGRKIPLQEILEKLTNKHEKYMRINSDDELELMQAADVARELLRINEYHDKDKDEPLQNLKDKIKKFQRNVPSCVGMMDLH